MIHRIVIYPDRRLKTPCTSVAEFDSADLHQLVADLFDSMYSHGGVGLAAPQIGAAKCVAVVDLSLGREADQRIALVNPVVVRAEGTQVGEEGCLSFPGFSERVERSMSVVVSARNEEGAAFDLQVEGLLARALQHEIDHLNGVVFIERMCSLSRELIRRKIRRLTRAGDWEQTHEE